MQSSGLVRDTKAIEEGNGRRKVGFLVNAEARMSEAREGGGDGPGRLLERPRRGPLEGRATWTHGSGWTWRALGIDISASAAANETPLC